MCFSSHNYNEIIRIYLTSYLNLKPVNWSFINNQLTVQLTSFGSQHCTEVTLSSTHRLEIVTVALIIYVPVIDDIAT